MDLICDEVENISNGKDLSKRLSLPKAKDELYELSEKFNGMFERLELSFEKERQFTSDVSHELRTPVAVINSQCEYLLENDNLSAEDKEEIAVILRQAKRMSKLTSEMLMIARNEQDEQHLMEKLDFGLLSELVIEELQTKAQEKNIEITLQKQDDLFMNGDQTLILRMMMNLITNAINYGKTNGHIHVILKVENDQIVGEVKDDGIGISEEHLDKIWERFYRIDKSRSRENGGTGLGLSMVRWIVNLTMEPFTSKVSKISERVLFSDFRKYKGLSLYIQFLFTKEKGSLFNMKVWMKLLVKKKGPYPFWI